MALIKDRLRSHLKVKNQHPMMTSRLNNQLLLTISTSSPSILISRMIQIRRCMRVVVRNINSWKILIRLRLLRLIIKVQISQRLSILQNLAVVSLQRRQLLAPLTPVAKMILKGALFLNLNWKRSHLLQGNQPNITKC